MQTNHIDDESLIELARKDSSRFDLALNLTGIVLCLIAFAVLFTVVANPVPVS